MDAVVPSQKNYSNPLFHPRRSRFRTCPPHILLGILVIGLGTSWSQTAPRVTLAWDPISGPNLAGYKLYYGTASRLYFTSNTIPAPSITSTVSNLIPGRRYYFSVTAYSFDGSESDYSTELSYLAPQIPGPRLPAIMWERPTTIRYGTPLSSLQLNATANVPGVFLYTPLLGTLLNAGSRTLSTVFIPLDLLNYRPVTNTITLLVQPAALTITAGAKSKVYGAPLPQLTATYTGFVNGDTPASLDSPPVLTTSATTASSAGSYSIDLGGAADANYLITQVNGTLTVTPATLRVTANDASKTFGQPNPTYTASYLGFVNGDTPASLDIPPTFSTTASASSSVGTYPINVSGTADANYVITHSTGRMTIVRASLLIRADNKSRGLSEANPTLTASYSGFVNGDNAASLDSPVSLATSATANSPLGTYPILAAGAADPNYAITYRSGTLTITNDFRAFINFQPAGVPVPAGYLLDDGALYGNRGNGRTYGWNASNVGFAVDRDSSRSPDQRYDTFHYMQELGGGSVWEIAVPNGRYRVQVVSGDPTRRDILYNINVEGVRTVSGDPSPTGRWVGGTSLVTVGDGRLTISNGIGAENNKICFVEVMAVTDEPAGALIAWPPWNAVRIVNLRQESNGAVTLQVENATELTYVVETSSDLRNWTEVGVVELLGNELTFNGETGVQRYFRVRNTP